MLDQKIKKLAKHSPVEQPYYHYHAIARSSDNVLYVGGRGASGLLFMMKHQLNLKLYLLILLICPATSANMMCH